MCIRDRSSAPTDVAAYKPHLLIQDIQQLAATESADGTMAALVAGHAAAALKHHFVDRDGVLARMQPRLRR